MWLWAAWSSGDPAHRRGVKLNDHSGPFQPRPFYDSMILQHYQVGGTVEAKFAYLLFLESLEELICNSMGLYYIL